MGKGKGILRDHGGDRNPQDPFVDRLHCNAEARQCFSEEDVHKHHEVCSVSCECIVGSILRDEDDIGWDKTGAMDRGFFILNKARQGVVARRGPPQKTDCRVGE